MVVQHAQDGFDVVVVGAGIVGLSHAWQAVQRGLSVAVVERDQRCIGASIRNFGFVTVTGQGAGDTWRRARRSRDIWAELAPQAGIAVQHAGLWVLAQRPAAAAVLQAFAATAMGEACELLTPAQAAARAPMLRTQGAAAALYSPHELRVESREAIPQLAAWLAREHGVRFFHGEAVLHAEQGRVATASRQWWCERAIVCPGTDLQGLAAAWLAPYALKLTQLQMLRVRPGAQIGWRLPAAVMSDLSLVRYRGYAALPEAAALQQQLQAECPQSLAHGIHLIAVQSADGSWVVGDSHHDDPSPWPFGRTEVDELMLAHLCEALNLQVSDLSVSERWSGVYPVGHSQDALVLAPEPGLRVVLITSGTGASTAFGLAEEVWAAW